MSFVTSYVVPTVKAMVYIGVVGGLGIWITYIFLRAWYKKWKYDFKYNILRKKINEDDIKWCVERIDEGLDYVDIKKILLVNGQSQARVNEVVWIFNKISKEIQKMDLKGGKNGGKVKRCIRQDQSKKLPTSYGEEAD